MKELKRRFKDWLFNRYLAEASSRAMAMAQRDMLETMEDDLEKRAQIIADRKVKDLYVPIKMDSVITMTKNGVIYINGTQADDAMLANLKSEAEAITQFNLFKILQETPRALAERAMFLEDGNIEAQLLKGRAVIYMLDSQKRVIELLKNVQIKK